MRNFLIVLGIMICHPLIFAHKELDLLLEGTAVTPTLSGLQISLLREGSLTENFVLGSSQLHTDEQPPLRNDHKIRVASISKLAVALGVFRLVEKEKIDLDKEATEYLGWSLKNPAFPRSPIKLRYLLSHTSSVRDGSRYFIQAGKGKIQDFLTQKQDYGSSVRIGLLTLRKNRVIILPTQISILDCSQRLSKESQTRDSTYS